MQESYEAASLGSRNANPLIQPSRQALRRALDRPQRRLLDAVVEAAQTLHYPLWLVGGAVRDLALGRPLRDLDFATGGDPAALAHALAGLSGCTLRVEPRFGTASLTIGAATEGEVRADVAALRSEVYTRPAALPTVCLGASIEADLARRDFTVNAMALPLAAGRARLIDPFGGLANLAARRLRVLHDRSLIDDPTRLLRAARLGSRLGLRLEHATAALVAGGVAHLHAVSPRRLWNEFTLLAAEPRPGAAVARLDRCGVLRGVHPALLLDVRSRRATARLGPCTPELLLALLLAPLDPGVRHAVAARLGSPRSALHDADDAARLMTVTVPVADAAAPELLASIAASSAPGRTAALRLDPAGQRPLQNALRRWERTRSPLTTEALLAIGVERGPALGALLAQLRRERYLGTLNGAAAARRFARDWMDTADATRASRGRNRLGD